MFKKIALLCLIAIALLPLAAKQIPLAPAIPDTLTHLGTQMIDNFAWLKQRENPQLHKQLKLEEKYCCSELKPSAKLSKTLLAEFNAWIPQQETSPRYLDNGYYYYSKSTSKLDYPIHYRIQNAPLATEELVMDENKMAKGKDFFALSVFTISPNSRFLAYSADFNGDEIYHLYIQDLHSRHITDSGISGISDFLWQSDSRYALITMQNQRLQSNKCYRLDTNDFSQSLLFTESDPAFDLGIYFSGDKSYMFLLSSSKNSSECYYLNRADVKAKPALITPRKNGHQYYPDALGNEFYIQSNLTNPDYSIYTCSIDKPDWATWQELVKAETGCPISSYLLFTDYLVMIRRLDGFERIQILSRSDAALLDEIIPPGASDLSFWHNPDARSKELTYSSENELNPYTIYSYDFATQNKTEIYQSPLTQKYDPAAYISSTVMVKAKDGTDIPLSLIYRKGLDVSKPHPLWLSAYGAYGDTNDPYFSTLRLSLLNRDIIYAVAHIRGGGEFGQNWYDDGRLQHKQNSFTDFIACLDYIAGNGLSTPAQIVIEGGSAGGLLMGAVTNLAPDKMTVVIADVPFVDLLNTMLDDSLPLTLQEYEEW
ncbi:MAG: prolyl oligopeptidase family serine peptidase, partial [Candidatus Cloacimonas sp.]|nr:prolyl oligopeptidase family serine peptidase [Candidatus Cloacimonas sp.]